MNLKKAIILPLALLFITFSCDSDDNGGVDNFGRLTAHGWKISDIDITVEVSNAFIGLDETIQITELPPCYYDEKYTFADGGVILVEYGNVPCDGVDETGNVELRSWQLLEPSNRIQLPVSQLIQQFNINLDDFASDFPELEGFDRDEFAQKIFENASTFEIDQLTETIFQVSIRNQETNVSIPVSGVLVELPVTISFEIDFISF